MRKIIASTTIAASLIGGGATAIVLAPGIAGAQDETEAAEATGLSEVLAELVTENTLTQAQADAVQDAIEQAAEDGRLGPRGRGGKRGHRGFGNVLEELDIDRDAVREGIQDGLTPGEIAEANGSSAEALTDALTDQMNERLDTAVENGRLDETEADEKRAEIAERVEDIVNGEIEFGRKGHGPRGLRGGATADETPSEETGA